MSSCLLIAFMCSAVSGAPGSGAILGDLRHLNMSQRAYSALTASLNMIESWDVWIFFASIPVVCKDVDFMCAESLLVVGCHIIHLELCVVLGGAVVGLGDTSARETCRGAHRSVCDRRQS